MDRITDTKDRDKAEDGANQDGGNNTKVYNEREGLRELLDNYQGIFR